MPTAPPAARTLGELRAAGYGLRSLREEIQANLRRHLREGLPLFTKIRGYDDTVVPAVENALLSGHDMIFLGERGQAKTRMIRSLRGPARRVGARWSPAARSTTIPWRRSRPSRAQQVAEQGDATRDRLAAPGRPLRREARHPGRLHRRPDRRRRSHQGRRGPPPGRRVHHPLRPAAAQQPRHLLHQRAARPDGEGAGGAVQRDGGARRPGEGLPGAPAPRRAGGRQREPRGLHQPRSHHHAAEGPLRGADPHPLSRGTARPSSRSCGRRRSSPAADGVEVVVPDYMEQIVGEITFQARSSPDVSQSSGVSVRMSIANYETLVASAVRRALRRGEAEAVPRISDLEALLASTTGKLELEYAGVRAQRGRAAGGHGAARRPRGVRRARGAWKSSSPW